MNRYYCCCCHKRPPLASSWCKEKWRITRRLQPASIQTGKWMTMTKFLVVSELNRRRGPMPSMPKFTYEVKSVGCWHKSLPLENGNPYCTFKEKKCHSMFHECFRLEKKLLPWLTPCNEVFLPLQIEWLCGH